MGSRIWYWMSGLFVWAVGRGGVCLGSHVDDGSSVLVSSAEGG